jgi:rhodanese-related sulfurtransferase
MLGKPRDLENIIFNIAPTDTPFLTICRSGGGGPAATQTLHEWTTDTLAAPADNAQVEGSDTTAFEGSAVTEMHNQTQILRKAVQVSGTAQSVKQAGVSNQWNYQVGLRMKEIKKDLERALLSNRIEAAGNKTTARNMRGAPCFITTNVNLGDGGAVATNAAACTAGTIRELTEDMLKDVLLLCYEAGGNPTLFMASPANRAKISTLLMTPDNRTANVDDKRATATINVYVSDWGNIKIVPNRVMTGIPYTETCIFAIDTEYWRAPALQGRGFKDERLAKTGDSIKGHIIGEYTLVARQPDSSGMIADIGTPASA